MSRTSSLAAPLAVVALALSSAAWAQVPLDVNLTLSPEGTVSVVDGAATISGTLFCSKPVYASVYGRVTQKHGREVVSGWFYTSFLCNGLTPWSTTVVGDNGRFVSGRVRVLATGDGYDPETGESDYDQEELIVQLRNR